MNQPTVSVIIPTYNGEKYICQTIDSVLAQTYKNFEMLIIDDGSADKTKEVLEKYENKILYFYKSNGGVSAARNYGIEKASGKYVAFLDADDVWLPEKLEKQIAALSKNPDCRVCYTAFTLGDENLQPVGETRSQREKDVLTDLLLIGNIVGTPSTVIAEKQSFKAAGGFDSELSQCADWEMWVRLATRESFVYIDEPLIIYRQHNLNMSKNMALLETDSVKVMEKAFFLSELPESLKKQKQKAFAKTYMVSAGSYFQAGQYGDFLRCAWKSVRLDSSQLTYLFSFPLRRFSNRQG